MEMSNAQNGAMHPLFAVMASRTEADKPWPGIGSKGSDRWRALGDFEISE